MRNVKVTNYIVTEILTIILEMYTVIMALCFIHTNSYAFMALINFLLVISICFNAGVQILYGLSLISILVLITLTVLEIQLAYLTCKLLPKALEIENDDSTDLTEDGDFPQNLHYLTNKEVFTQKFQSILKNEPEDSPLTQRSMIRAG